MRKRIRIPALGTSKGKNLIILSNLLNKGYHVFFACQQKNLKTRLFSISGKLTHIDG
jgi:hypothetical protein